MITASLTGAGFALGGFRWLTRPGLRRFLLLPLLVNLVVFGAAVGYTLNRFGGWLTHILPDAAHWLWWIVVPLLGLVLLVVVFFTFTMVANLLASPFNDRLAEKMVDRLGHRFDERERSGAWPAQIIGAVAGELKKWLYFALLACVALLFWLIPFTTLLAPLIWLLVSVWILAFEYLDYPLNNAGLNFTQKHRWIRRHGWHALGFGATLTALTLIPVVNFAVMPAAVCGATELWVYCERRDRG